MIYIVHHDGTVAAAHAEYFVRWGEYHYCGVSGTTEREAVTRWAKDRPEVAAVADTEDDAREMARLVTARAEPAAPVAEGYASGGLWACAYACGDALDVVAYATSGDGRPDLARCVLAGRWQGGQWTHRTGDCALGPRARWGSLWAKVEAWVSRIGRGGP